MILFNKVFKVIKRIFSSPDSDEHNEMFKQLFNNMDDGVAIYSAVDDGQDFVFVDINRRGQEVSTVSLKKIVGRRVTEIFPFVKEFGLLDILRRVYATGKPQELPLTEYKDNRISQWVENYVFKLPSGLVVAIYKDTTEKQKIIEELRESRETLKLSNLILSTQHEASPDGILVVDNTGKIILYNNKFISIWGIPSEVIEKKSDDLALQSVMSKLQNPKEFLDRVRSLYENKSEISREEILLKDGRVLDRHSSPMVDTNGICFGRVWFFRDITEEKRVANMIIRNRMFLQAASEIAKIGGWEFVVSTMSQIWSEEVYRILEVGPDYHPDVTKWMEFCPQEARPIILQAVQQSINFGKQFDLEMPLITAKGKHIWIRVIGRSIRKDGKTIKVVGAIQDISERKKNDEIIHRAEKLESLGVLAGGIAHDFNNLLSGIFGYIELAKSNCVEGKFDEISDNLSQAIKMYKRAKNLSYQLLTFSKGGLPATKAADIGPVIKESTNFALSGTNLKLALNLPDDLYQCKIDENQIGQVINNIVLNAKQAMPMGGLISVSARNVYVETDAYTDACTDACTDIGTDVDNKSGRSVCICITDQGGGIPAEHLPRIFDPYFTTKQTGSGLGLAVAHSVIKKHGGNIKVKSILGQGTTFYIHLPAVAAAADLLT
ncbi:MAG: PAS domain-containing protein, partial [Oligoflexia bacterium]|nr:PAS domain-containing protein [Oligoflexia bacterium]